MRFLEPFRSHNAALKAAEIAFDGGSPLFNITAAGADINTVTAAPLDADVPVFAGFATRGYDPAIPIAPQNRVMIDRPDFFEVEVTDLIAASTVGTQIQWDSVAREFTITAASPGVYAVGTIWVFTAETNLVVIKVTQNT